MTHKILHSIIFLFIAGIVVWTFRITSTSDPMSVFFRLPALMIAGVYAGLMFIFYILPVITDKATTAVFSSSEQIEKGPMHDARAAVGQGDYKTAMKEYRRAMVDDPSTRLPWVEIAKIQVDYLDDPRAAIATIREAIESQAWHSEDIGFFMGRLAEIYIEHLDDKKAAIAILQQMIDRFPNTRYSANATHHLHEIEQAGKA